MPVEREGEKLFSMSEACEIAGTNRSTCLRWIRQKRIPDSQYRDRNGWRLFTGDEINRLKQRVSMVQQANPNSVR
jgi:hypothetical protein